MTTSRTPQERAGVTRAALPRGIADLGAALLRRPPVPVALSGAQPDAPVLRGTAQNRDATVTRYDIGHVDVHVGEPFEQAVTDQLAFLAATVPVR